MIMRNVYGTAKEVQDENISKIAAYINEQWVYLGTLSLEDFKNGKKIFIEKGEA